MSAYSQQSSASASPLQTIWRLPGFTVARFTLLSYIRSGWILLDIVGVWLLYAAFFLQSGGNVVYFYSIAGPGLAALAALGTVVMTIRALSARVYLPLARLTSRASYVRGLVLATSLLRIPLFLLLLAMTLLYHNGGPTPCTPACIEGATPGNMLPGALGLLANCVLVAALTVTFSAPIATRLARIVLLAWIAAVLYSNADSSALASALSFTRIPLEPLIAAYSLGASMSIDWLGALALLIEAAYILFLLFLAQYWLGKRDLLLH